MTSIPEQEVSLARAALDEIAPGAVGDYLETVTDEALAGVAELRFASRLDGYPDWVWVALLSRDIEGSPTVLEAAMMPGEGSLLAPAWVPWSERMADYLASKDSAEEHSGAGDDEDGEELESDLESDLDDDFDDDFDDDIDTLPGESADDLEDGAAADGTGREAAGSASSDEEAE